MAGVPPSSSADFTPSWLKFNSIKQVDKEPAKNNSRQHVCKKSSMKCSSIAELENSIYLKKVAGHASSDLNKAWSFSGLESNSNEKLHWPSTSHTTRKFSFSTICSNHRETSVKKLHASPAKHYSIDVDFPTLVTKPAPVDKISPIKQGNNMWNKPLVLKASDNIQNHSTTKQTNEKLNNGASRIYKSLVPKSNPSNVKQPYRRAVTFPSSNALYKTVPSFPLSKDVSKKKLIALTAVQTPALPLTKSTVEEKQTPDKLNRKGKNVCLKDLHGINESTLNDTALQPHFHPASEDKNTAHKEKCDQVENDKAHKQDAQLRNLPNTPTQEKDWWEEINTDLYDLSADTNNQDIPPLSSSLEAEHRLLRQMGWTECEDGADGDATGSDESPLTEAEIREFFLNNKKRGLLSVPSPSHRETAFRDALSSWILSGPPVMRRNLLEKEKKSLNDSSSSICSVSSDFSHPSSCGMDSD